MQTADQKAALMAAKSTKKQPQTQVGELREVLTTIEKRLTRLNDLSREDALGVLPLLDQARERLEALEVAGGIAGTEGLGRSEAAQFESLLLLLDKKGATFLYRAGGPEALRDARQERHPDESDWWWFLDEVIAQRRQSKVKRWAIGAAIVWVVLVALVLVYNHFFAPDPVFQAGVGFQQYAENKLIQGQYEEALADVDQAIELLPDHPNLYVLQGVIYEMLEQPDLTRQSYELAREGLDEATFYNERARYYFLVGQAEASLADAQMALSINPDSAVSYMHIAQAYELLGDVTKAIDYYELASETAERTNNPTLQVMARMQLANLMQQLNMPTLEAPQE